MDKLLKPGRIMFATGILALSILCIIYRDFIIGRPPAWPSKFTINPALAYISAAALIIAAISILFERKAGPAALLIAILILLLSVFRHLPSFMIDWVNAYKAMAFFGGALIIAASFFRDDDHITPRFRVNERWKKGLLVTGTILLAVFLIACGFAHFKWAQGVQNFVPGYIPFRLFWTYFCGVCLLAGGAGLLIPQTKSLAALLSGIMILGWFILLHIPAFLANPNNPSDRMGVCESFIFSGILFVLAGIVSKKSNTRMKHALSDFQIRQFIHGGYVRLNNALPRHIKNQNTKLSKESDTINCDLPARMAISEIQSYIGAAEKTSSLYEEKNFDKRIEVIDLIEFQVIEQIGEFLQKTAQPDKLILLKYRAQKLKSELENIDITLFQRLQANIRLEGYAGKEFKNLISEYVDFNLDNNEHQEETGYDNLDIFINGLFSFQTMPEQTKDLEPEMVYYQKTPARIVFELVEKSQFMKEDVFFDLGSGLGQLTILINLLAGITAKGVEIEPAFCDYARDCAAELNLSGVTFLNIDARKADYSEGTIFFMFTPFRGEILQAVLEILRKESLRRKIKIITYGPCTAQVALQNWLDFATTKDDNMYKLSFFTSFGPRGL